MGKSDRKKISKNALCPCGSRKRYKNCCFSKDFDYVVDGEGRLNREVPLNEEIQNIVERQKQLFFEKYGREMEPEDPVFFDVAPLEHIEARIAEGMRNVGIDPAIIYAFEKTGFFVTELNYRMIPESDLDLWNEAVEEYRALREMDKSQEFF